MLDSDNEEKQVAFNWGTLPDDTQYDILTWLSPQELARFSATSPEAYNLAIEVAKLNCVTYEEIIPGKGFTLARTQSGQFFLAGLTITRESITTAYPDFVPVSMAEFDESAIRSVIVNGYHIMLLTTEGKLFWGQPTPSEELKNCSILWNFSPIPLLDNCLIQSVVIGDKSMSALDTKGQLYTSTIPESPRDLLGHISFTELTSAASGTPITFTIISSGFYHGLAIDTEGRLYGWRNNEQHQLSLAGTHLVRSPTHINIPGVVKAIAAGPAHSLAVTEDGFLYGWGGNYHKQLGEGAYIIGTPTLISIPGVVTAVATGADHTLALTADGEVYAWGSNNFGQVGVGMEGGVVLAPTLIPVPGIVTAIVADRTHSFAVTENGLYAWGNNSCGLLGVGKGHPRIVNTPTRNNWHRIADRKNIVRNQTDGTT